MQVPIRSVVYTATALVQVIEILVEESNVQPVNSPVTVRSGVRSSYTSVMRIYRRIGTSSDAVNVSPRLAGSLSALYQQHLWST